MSDQAGDLKSSWQQSLPPDTKVYEIEGPFFFAVADLLADVPPLRPSPRRLIVRMRSVPFIDSTAANALRRFSALCAAKHVELYIAELRPDVRSYLRRAEFFETFPKERVINSVEELRPPAPAALR